MNLCDSVGMPLFDDEMEKRGREMIKQQHYE